MRDQMATKQTELAQALINDVTESFWNEVGYVNNKYVRHISRPVR